MFTQTYPNSKILQAGGGGREDGEVEIIHKLQNTRQHVMSTHCQ